ncbi:hypothetical protein L207DRAFT_532336 [Hyaloscypha variabilis F]|uniref:Rhodopsin domain-containing protein n=1 Tax=Hyaloscypha variabilis (strain UAMH 11265 / GT02V1 / F) TaxID=1149755 RepID=A0A2J6RDZ1_HYAVF|nr:hypothetical protein L207DRAFT_532336 [Hyaloscypha variabilis F]
MAFPPKRTSTSEIGVVHRCTPSQEIVAVASAVSSAAASAAASTAASTALPSGITAPLESISSTDVGGLVAILSAFALSLVLVSFPIRVYVRSKFSAYKSDDYAFVLATVFAILQASGVFYELGHGLGKSIDLVDPQNLIKIQRAAYGSDILYIVTLFFTKLSTAFLFLRLTPGRGHSIAIWSTISMTVAWALISIFLVAIRCHAATPWLDTTSAVCSNLFARWQFIAALDILTEIGLFSISLYLIWGIQMSIKSKTIVVTSFGCRLPVIAIAGLRLYYLHLALTSTNPTLHGTPESTSVTQIEIGYAILASIVPCLKNFMAAYDAPIQSMHWYPTPSNTGYTHELASVATGKSKSAKSQLSVSVSRSVDRESPEVVEKGTEEVYNGGRKGGGARILSSGLGRLRPEQISYEARVEFKDREGERSSREEDGVGRRSVESGNSRRMIIKKGVEWSVDYDRRSREEDGA